MSTPLYQGGHRTQFDGSRKAKENCTPTSGANGARAATGGKIDLSGGSVRARVAQSEETDPGTPGWSMVDLDLAMKRLGVPFERGTGGWAGVRAARQARFPIVLQGDSEEFPNGTCSGVFDGDHAVCIHADDYQYDGSLWLLADSICKVRRWESEAVLQRYASNFRASISYGFFPIPTPVLTPPKPPATPTILGWVRVTGAFWPYKVRGNPTIGYDETSRPTTSKVTKGFSANVGQIIEAHWGERDRSWGKVLAPSVYAGIWVDLLDEPNVRYIEQ